MKENSVSSENVEHPCEGHRIIFFFYFIQEESVYSSLEHKNVSEGLHQLIFSLLLLLKVCVTTYSHWV